MPLPVLPRRAIVLDIETLDTTPTACVLSVGFAQVDLHDLVITDWGQLYVDQNEQIGRTVSESTTKWWAGQPEAWRRQCGVERASIRETFTSLGDLAINLAGLPDQGATWWGYGPSFDLVVLENLAAQHSLTPPWTYRDHRDLRTLFELAGVKPGQFRKADEVEHDAEADALVEARAMIAALKALGFRQVPVDAPAVMVGA